jgi:DNA-binding MarR family transcriptional regulator
MVATGPGVRVEDMAREVFEVLTDLGLAVPHRRRREGDLKEIEFLTLALLHGRGTMIVGELQRRLRVLPAQMSRIIRALEDRDRPMIACHINPRDKRKVDVRMTPAGEKALLDYQASRVDRITAILRDLPEELQEDLGRLLAKLRDVRDTARGRGLRKPGLPGGT